MALNDINIAQKKLDTPGIAEFIVIIRRKTGRLDWVVGHDVNVTELVDDFYEVRNRILRVSKEKRTMSMAFSKGGETRPRTASRTPNVRSSGQEWRLVLTQ